MQKYGGYRSGELFTTKKRHLGSHFHFYDCARHAIHSLCQNLKLSEICTPNFYCKPIDEYLLSQSYKITNYPINGFANYSIPQFRANALLVIVNLFGLSDLESLIETACFEFNWPTSKILVDSSLSLFDLSGMNTTVAHLFSPRKFLPITEGGIIFSPFADLVKGEDLDEHEYEYRSQLLDPENLLSEAGTQVYQYIERSFSIGHKILSLGETQAFKLASFDLEKYQNLFCLAHSRFSNFPGLISSSPRTPGNCVLINKSYIKNANIRDSSKGVFTVGDKYTIFLPKYWIDIAPTTDFEQFLFDEVAFIPVFWDISLNDVQYVRKFLYGDCSKESD